MASTQGATYEREREAPRTVRGLREGAVKGPLFALFAAALALAVVVACSPAGTPNDRGAFADSLRGAGEVVKEKRKKLEADGGP